MALHLIMSNGNWRRLPMLAIFILCHKGYMWTNIGAIKSVPEALVQVPRQLMLTYIGAMKSLSEALVQV